MKTTTFIDLFAGIGGFRLGIERASAKLQIPTQCVFSSEIEKNAVKVYEKNFKETPSGDITKINATDIPDFDILCGGFPCQDLSIAGKRKGLQGERSGLFFDIIRILKEKQPRIVFLENVKGLFSSNAGWDFARVLIELEDAGYDVEWQLLNSKDFGVPQNRERVYIIGHLRGSRTRQVFPIFGETGATTRENSSTCLDANYGKGIDNHGARTGIIQYFCGNHQEDRVIDTVGISSSLLNTSYKKPPQIIQHYCGSHQQDRVLDPEGISSCLPTGTGGDLIPEILHPKLEYVGAIKSENKWLDDGKDLSRNYPQGSRVYHADGIATTLSSQCGGIGGKTGLYQLRDTRIRKLTPIECERLQGFPDGYTEGISDSMRYKCLGNSVTVNVIKAIAEKLLCAINREDQTEKET